MATNVKTCEECGMPFVPEKGKDYTRSCLPCWKKSKDYELTKADNALIALQSALAAEREMWQKERQVLLSRAAKKEKGNETRKSPSRKADSEALLTLSRIKELITLCHPDKHDGSEKANDVTKWLLGLRETLKR